MAALSDILDGLNLNTGGYFVASRDYGSPNMEPELAPRARGGVERLVSQEHGGSRRIQMIVECKGASKDATIALVTALYQKLPRAGKPVNLVVTPTDATNAVTFVCIAVEGPLTAPYDIALDVGNVARVPLTLVAEPYAYGTETTLVNAVSTTYPAVLDVTVPGDFAAPLQLTFTGSGLHCLYVGLLPNQSTALPLQEAESLTWSDGANASDASARGGSCRRLTGVNATATSLDTGLPAGTWKFLARMAAEGAGTVRCVISTATAISLAVSATGWQLDELGTMAVPAKAVRGSGASSAEAVMYNDSATAARLDYLMRIPQSWGWAQWQPLLGATTTSSLVIDYDSRIYVGDVADGLYGRCGGLAAVGAQRLVIAADTAHGSGAAGGTIALTTTVKVVPRYALWR